jgi:hypothetical protein
MPVDIDGVISLLNLIAKEEQVKVNVQQSFKGALIAGVGVFLGGLMGGSKGLVAGGAAGTALGYLACADHFVSLPTAIQQLPDERKKLIAEHINQVVEQLKGPETVETLIQLAREGPEVALRNEKIQYIMKSGLDYVRNQVEAEQRTNADFLST